MNYEPPSDAVPLRDHLDLRITELEKAFLKAERNLEIRLHSMNEFRSALNDQAARTMTRPETDSKFDSAKVERELHIKVLETRIQDIEKGLGVRIQDIERGLEIRLQNLELARAAGEGKAIMSARLWAIGVSILTASAAGAILHLMK